MSRSACVIVAVGVTAAAIGLAAGGRPAARRDLRAAEARGARGARRAGRPPRRDPRGRPRREEPAPASPEIVAEGLAHFADRCASCHANDGSGDPRLGRGLFPRAPDLRAPATQELTDGELFYVIENGVRLTGMPAWGGTPGSAEASWHLVRFIRHLPRRTEAERMQMEALNPRSPGEWRAREEEDAFLRGEPARAPAGGDEHAHHREDAA